MLRTALRARCRRAGRPGQPDPVGARRRGRGAGRAARRTCSTALAGRRGDPGRRAGRRGARAVLGGVRAGRPHRRPDRLGAAAGRRARRAGRRRRADPAARRPPGDRRRGPRRGRAGLGPAPPARCRPRRAGTPTPCWTPRRPASWPRWWSAGSTRTTWPIRPPRWPRCAGSGFLVSLELQHSRGHRAGRRGAPGRPGRAARRQLPQLGGPAAASSARRWTPAACCRTAGCWTPWPSRWTSTSSPRPRPPRPASWPGSARRAGVRAAAPQVARAPSRCAPGYGQAVLATLAAADRRRLAGRRRARAGRHRPPGAGPVQRGDRGAARAGRGRAGHRAHRAGRDHAAAGAGRPARRRGLAAGQLARLPGPRPSSASGTATWWG